MVHIATRNNNAVQLHSGASLTSTFKDALSGASGGGKPPWDSIIDFATHPSFCGLKLYPRQQTLLKLMHLETENMTAYDLDVIEEWRTNFARLKDRYGVQPDIWQRVDYLKNNGYTHFPHIQAVQGRRASKGVMGGILGTERIAHMIALDDPQAHYGIMSESIYLMVIATNSLQAKRFLFADIRKIVSNNKWLEKYVSVSREQSLSLRTPADIRHIAEMRAKKIPIEYEIASIRVLPMSSISTSGRGAAAFMIGYDEMAHMITGTGGNRSSEEVYEAYQPSLDQFSRDALTYIPSSPFSKVGRFFELYTHGSVLLKEFKGGKELIRIQGSEELDEDPEETFTKNTADPTMLVIQLPSWELYRDWERGKQLVGVKFKRAVQYSPVGEAEDNLKMARLKRRNPVKFKVEREAQFAEVMNAYLNSDKIEAMFSPFWGESEKWPGGRVLSETKRGVAAFKYHGHADPSKSNANFAVAVAHLEQSPIPDIVMRDGKPFEIFWPHVIVDYMNVWKPEDYEDHIVDYIDIGERLLELPQWFPTMNMFSYDQFNSAGFIANMKRRYAPRLIIKEETFTVQSTQNMFEGFKSALNLGWVHAYRDNLYGSKEERIEGMGLSLLELECQFLSEKNGKVVKQESGPVTTKDLFDCVATVTVRLLKDSLDRWYKEVLGRDSILVGSEGGHPKSGPAGDHQRESANNPLKRNLSNLESYRYSGAGVDPSRGRLATATGQPRGWGQRPQGFGLRGRLGSGR
ncbi:MAG TPA: hypothetical protein VIY48_05290 [Candidatus Paceibacterota bacterium]